MDHDTHLMPSSTFEALKKLRKNGIRLFVATRRPPNNLKVIQDCFEFDGFLTSNGQYCFNHEVVIHEKYIEREDIRNLLPYINKNQIPVLFVEIKGNYSNIQNYCHDEAARSLNKEGYPIKAVNEIIESKIIQLMAYIDETKDSERLSYMPNCKSARWTSLFADIIPIDGGENKGIDQMIKHYQINLGEVMAFGDGNNDIDMLKHVGVGVAMGNANDLVKAASDFVTDTINDDGIFKALKNLN